MCNSSFEIRWENMCQKYFIHSSKHWKYVARRFVGNRVRAQVALDVFLTVRLISESAASPEQCNLDVNGLSSELRAHNSSRAFRSRKCSNIGYHSDKETIKSLWQCLPIYRFCEGTLLSTSQSESLRRCFWSPAHSLIFLFEKVPFAPCTDFFTFSHCFL